jgi:hypothetical protein
VAGVGVTIWDVTDQRAKFVKTVTLEAFLRRFTAAVWGIYWQGDTIYIGGTNTGLHILDAHDPTNVTFVKRLPTSAFEASAQARSPRSETSWSSRRRRRPPASRRSTSAIP